MSTNHQRTGRAEYLLFATLAAWHVAVLFRNFEINRARYVYGDWMINYAGGLVRRGLGGETLIWISDTVGTEAVHVAFALVSLLTLAFLALTAAVTVGRMTPFEVSALFSTPGLLFAAHNLEAGRKDILVLFLMAVSLSIASSAKSLRSLTFAAAALVVAALALEFAHEPIVFFAPALGTPIALAYLQRGARRAAILFAMGLPVVLGVALSVVASWGPLDWESVRQICAHLGASVPDRCTSADGAIGWLTRDTAFGIQASRAALELRLTNFAPGMAMGIMLLWFVARDCALQDSIAPALPRTLRSPIVHIAVFAAATLPLYLIAIDWGRWFSLWFTVSVLYLIGGRAAKLLVRRGAPQCTSGGRARSIVAAVALAAVSMFCPLPVTGMNPGGTVPRTIYVMLTD